MLLGHLRIQRSEKTIHPNYYRYDYRYYEPETGEISTGNLLHAREDGAKTLIKRILKEVCDEPI